MEYDTNLTDDSDGLPHQFTFKLSDSDKQGIEKIQSESNGYLAHRDKAVIVRYAIRKLIRDIFGD